MKKRDKIRTIGIAYNLKKEGAGDDRYEEYDEIETIEALAEEIRRNGYEAVYLEQDDDFLEKILRNRPDFVFNIAEGKGDTRSRESQVPCILESLNIPYSGSDPLALGITLDKYMTGVVLRSAGMPVPYMVMIEDIKQLDSLKDIFKGRKSFIVKPRWEGSSRGIFLKSVAANFRQLKERVRHILADYRQPAVVEEFVDGDEVTVGVYGNEEPRVLGMMKVTGIKQTTPFFIYSLENKRDWRNKIKYESVREMPVYIKHQLERDAVTAFRVLELRDVARIDFRIHKNDIPQIIDINPLPGLSPHYSDLPIMYGLEGGNYPDLIRKILRTALARYGFGCDR